MNKTFKIIASSVLLIGLVSCGEVTPTEKPTEIPTDTPTQAPTEKPIDPAEKGFVLPEEYETQVGMSTYKDLVKHDRFGRDYSPSLGDVKILVVPFAFSDSTVDDQKVIDDLNTTFNGSPEETGWESVTSFFEKSSFGQLHLDFTIAPTWRQSNKDHNYYGKDPDVKKTIAAVNSSLEWYKNTYNSDGTEFDADKNGHVDSVILVYGWDDLLVTKDYENDNLWAFTSFTDEKPNIENPTANSFIWLSYDFMYGNKGGSKHIKLDAHTYAHEFGHAMGLLDYYNYNVNDTVNPVGGFDMQDANVGDHNPYSKFTFGWEKPIVVTGPCEITIKAHPNNKNQSVIIPFSNNMKGFDEWNKSPFDEYLMLELYTPKGLNNFDVTHKTYKDTDQGPDKAGIRLYHVDSRVYAFDKNEKFADWQKGYVDDLNDDNYYYEVAATNTTPGHPAASPVGEASRFYQIHLLSATQQDTMQFHKSLSNDDLFIAGDSFDMNTYRTFFTNSGKANDRSRLKLKFSVTSLNEEEATLKFEKN